MRNNPLSTIKAVDRAPVLIVGAGNVLRSDDAAGCIVAERLSERFPDNVIDGGLVPENFTGPIRRFEPGTVVVVDAADFGAEPGDLYIAHEHEVAGDMFGTHGAPLSLFMRALKELAGCEVILVAIQIGCMEMNAPMTQRVESAVETLVESLSHVLERTTGDI